MAPMLEPGTDFFRFCFRSQLGGLQWVDVHTGRPLSDRFAAFAKDAREKAAQLPAGVERDQLLREIRQADTKSHLQEWCNSPGLQPPK